MPKLSMLVEIIGGGTPSKKNPAYWSGNIPWISVKDFKSSIISGSSEYITMEGVNNSATTIIPAGNLIVPTRMALGKVAVNIIDVAINQDLKALVIKDRNKIDRDFLLRVLESQAKEIERQGKGATVKGITIDVLKNLEIPLPPLKTQKQIALILEKADQLRKDCQKMEHELDNLAQSVFLEMFASHLENGPYLSLGEVSDIVSGVTKGQNLQEKETRRTPYMRVANVQAGYLDLSEIREIEVKLTDVDKYRLKVGDMLLTEGGDFDKLGRGALWEGQIENCIHQNHVFRVRLDAMHYLPEWFNGLLQTNYAKRYFIKCAKKTTNLASINITQLKSLPMPVVGIELQNIFIEKMKIIRAKKELTLSALREYELVFNSLMQKAFNGNLITQKEVA